MIVIFFSVSAGFFYLASKIVVMTNDIKEIHIGKGLGALVFGATREKVKNLLGEPTDVEKYSLSEFEDDTTEAWHYDDHDLSLSFDEENDWRLSSIAVSSDDYTLNGQSLVGKTKEDILEECRKNGWGAPEEDEDVRAENSGNSLLHVDQASMGLWFEGDTLTEVQIGPFYDNEGITWPG